MADFVKNDGSILYGPQICGEKVRALVQDKYEVIPKTTEHIRVIPEKCNGCQLCYITCPSGSYDMQDGKAVWAWGMKYCTECGLCRVVCPVNAIEWAYPDAGTGIVLKYS